MHSSPIHKRKKKKLCNSNEDLENAHQILTSELYSIPIHLIIHASQEELSPLKNCWQPKEKMEAAITWKVAINFWLDIVKVFPSEER